MWKMAARATDFAFDTRHQVRAYLGLAGPSASDLWNADAPVQSAEREVTAAAL